MYRKKIIQFVEKSTDMIINSRLNSSPYTDKPLESIKYIRT